MSAFSLRSRRIDADRPMPVFHNPPPEIELEAQDIPDIPTGMSKEEEAEKHLQEVLRASQADVAIPTPRVLVRAEYERESAAYLFARPNAYIIYTLPDSERVPVEYDLDSEDERWLGEYQARDRARDSHVTNGHARHVLDEDDLEYMIDTLEKHVGKAKHVTLTAQDAARLFHERHELLAHVTAVHQHWQRQRATAGQPLLRTLREPLSESSPYAAFIYRTEEKKSVRVLRPDHSLAAMRALRVQFEQTRELLHLITRREQCKRELVKHVLATLTAQSCEVRDHILLDASLFDGALEDTWLEDALFMNGKHKTRRRAPSDTLTRDESVSQLSAEELEVSDDESRSVNTRPEHAAVTGAVVPLSQLSLFDMDSEDPHWMKLVNLNSSSMPTFRGRARIGRGGRLLWDRVPIIKSLDQLPDCLDEEEPSTNDDKELQPVLMDLT